MLFIRLYLFIRKTTATLNSKSALRGEFHLPIQQHVYNATILNAL